MLLSHKQSGSWLFLMNVYRERSNAYALFVIRYKFFAWTFHSKPFMMNQITVEVITESEIPISVGNC